MDFSKNSILSHDSSFNGNLPNEIWFHILSFLSNNHLDLVFQINSYFYNLAKNFLDLRLKKIQDIFRLFPNKQKIRNEQEYYGIMTGSQHLLNRKIFKNKEKRIVMIKHFIKNQNLTMIQCLKWNAYINKEESDKLSYYLGRFNCANFLDSIFNCVNFLNPIFGHNYYRFSLNKEEYYKGAVNGGHLELTKELITQLEGCSQKLITERLYLGLIIASEKGHLRLVKFFISFRSIHRYICEGLVHAFKKGHLEIVNYLDQYTTFHEILIFNINTRISNYNIKQQAPYYILIFYILFLVKYRVSHREINKYKINLNKLEEMKQILINVYIKTGVPILIELVRKHIPDLVFQDKVDISSFNDQGGLFPFLDETINNLEKQLKERGYKLR